jgi:small-conductance mechanosensitive channel
MGDRIQVGNNERDDMYVKGDVIDIRLFKFTVLEIGTWIHSDQSTLRIIHVPNHAVFSK